MMQILVIVRNF